MSLASQIHSGASGYTIQNRDNYRLVTKQRDRFFETLTLETYVTTLDQRQFWFRHSAKDDRDLISNGAVMVLREESCCMHHDMSVHTYLIWSHKFTRNDNIMCCISKILIQAFFSFVVLRELGMFLNGCFHVLDPSIRSIWSNIVVCMSTNQPCVLSFLLPVSVNDEDI